MSELKISATEVNKLRQMTGAGMMDCKKALTEANGDFDAAIEYLRKKGQKVASNRLDREAKEGCCLAVVNAENTRGIVIRLSSETDFVSKNADFVAFANEVAGIAIANFPENTEALLALPMGNITVGDRITEQVGKIGERIEVAAYERLEAPMVVGYIHMGNRAAVILGLNKAGDFADAGRSAAMQVAAMRPIAVDKDGVDAEVVAKELAIAMDLARNEGKPEAMLERIGQGRVEKFYKENTLLNQEFVKDNSKTVAAYLKSIDKELTVLAFKRVELG